MRSIKLAQILPPVVFVGLVLATQCLFACPNCKDSLADSDPAGAGIVQGFFWSIIIMLSTPALVIAGLGTYFYWLIRQAQKQAAANPAPVLTASTVAPLVTN